MKKGIFYKLTVVALFVAFMASCHDVEEYSNSQKGNFEQLWKILDEHYCFFEEKGVDWDEIYERYSLRVNDGMTGQELFLVCAEMLDELKDGHVNLSAPFNTSYYRAWWSAYPQNYDARLVEQYYFNFNYLSLGGINFGILPDNVAYMRYPSFSYPLSDSVLDNILAYCATANGLIIDIRDNGGGDMTNVEKLFSRFIDRPTLAGYIVHKTGPGHDDFSEPYAVTYNPAGAGRFRWPKPVVVLTNRSTFSAANNFTAVMKQLPTVAIVGSTTGGGSGMPYSSELSNGWAVRFSACPLLDSEGNLTEFGVEPTEGCEVDLDPQAALVGRDTMLDFAVQKINSMRDE